MNIKEKFASELSIICQNVIVEGSLKGEGNFRIDGQIHGSVIISGNLTVGQHGYIKGNVEATFFALSGKVDGNIKVGEKLTLEKTSFINGDIATKILVVEEGANINGNCLMHNADNISKPKVEN